VTVTELTANYRAFSAEYCCIHN